MNMVKKVIVYSLSFVLLLNIAGCSSSGDNERKDTDKTNGQDEVMGSAIFDDSSCWTLSIDSIEYTFPMKYEEFVAKSEWSVYNQTLDDTLHPKQTTTSYDAIYTQTGTKFHLVLGNFGTEGVPYTEGYIVGIGIAFTTSDTKNEAFPEIVLPMEITFNTPPSVETIIKTYGEADSQNKNDLKYWYEGSMLNRCINFSIDEDNNIYGFELINYADPNKNDD